MSIRLDAVSFRYAGSPRDAVRDVSLEVLPGEIVLVTGKLGAGCSTLLLLMAGIAPHVTNGSRRGAVETLGVDPASATGRRVIAGQVGLLLPTPWTQLSGMTHTVFDEVAFGPANLGWDRTRIEDVVNEALHFAAVHQLATRDPRTLSGGELQRVMLAGVRAMRPDVYLLDEPAVELDPESAETVYGLLGDLVRGGSVVIASTDVDRLAAIVDRVVLLDNGQIIASGTPPDVLGDAAVGERAIRPTVARIAEAAGAGPALPLTVDDAVDLYAP